MECIRGWRRTGIADGDWATAETRRRTIALQGSSGDDDPTGHNLHPLSLGRKSTMPLTCGGAGIQSARFRNTRCAAVSMADAAPSYDGVLEPQQ